MARSGKHGFISTQADLRARCEVDINTRCWIWQGATNSRSRLPILYAWDFVRGEKRSMSGPRAAWSIAHGEAPSPGVLVHRACCGVLCLNPVHLRLARSKAEIGEHIRLSGSRKGTSLEARRANARLAWASRGIVATLPEVVRTIRATAASESSKDIAARLGMSHATVWAIRTGRSHREVV